MILNVDEEGNTTIDNDILKEAIEATQVTDLTQGEIDGILYMREEEKLTLVVWT